MTGCREHGRSKESPWLCGPRRLCEKIPLSGISRRDRGAAQRTTISARNKTCVAVRYPPHPSCRGLIMVEVAIAVLVLAFGVLAVFTLFNSGLNQTQKGSADTRIAMFANSVMATLNEESAHNTGPAWMEYWTDLSTGYTNIQPPFIYNASTNNNAIPGDGTLVTNAYEIVTSSGTNYFSHAFRCSMTVRFRSSAAGDLTNAAAVTLRVWEGFFGSTSDVDAAIFYTEYPNAGL